MRSAISSLAKTLVGALILTLLPFGIANATASSQQPVAINFDLSSYPTTQSDLISRSGNIGEDFVLPAFSYSDIAFTGWSDGSTTYAAGDSYPVSGPVTFSPQFYFSDARIPSMTLSAPAGVNYEFFPAFDPNVFEYYLNVNQYNFGPITLSFALPKNGGIAHIIEVPGGITGLVTPLTGGNQTESYVITPQDMRTLSSPREDAQVAALKLRSKSEQQREENSLQSYSEYVIHLTRQASSPAIVGVYFDLGPDATGTMNPIFTPGKYLRLPTSSGIARAGFALDGWRDVETNWSYEPGEVILLTDTMEFQAVWESLEPVAVTFAGYQQDPSSGVRWRSLPLDNEDPAFIDYYLDMPYLYRISLLSPAGQVVSRFSNDPLLASQNLSASSNILGTCITQNECLSLFTIRLESWESTISSGVSSSYHIMRPTQSGEVCLSVENMRTPNSGVEEFDCRSSPRWIRVPNESDYGVSAGEYAVWQGQRSGDVRVVSGYRFDLTDLNSHLYAFDERVPVFSDLTIQTVWAQDDNSLPSSIELFGQLYDFVDCMSLDDEPEEIRCLANVESPSTLIYPKTGEDQAKYYFAQEFTETWWSATLSANLFTEYEFWVSGRNGQDLLEDSGDNLEELNIGMEYLDSDLCPVGNCGAIYNLYLTGESTFGFNDLEMSFHILRRPSSSAQIAYQFSMAGGTGLSTQSFVGQVGWVTPPDVDGVTKSGAVHRDDWIISASHELLIYGSLVPIWFDGQVMSLEWLPAYEARFRDHLTGGILSTVYIRQQLNTWSVQNIPTTSHPLGRPLLGWTSVSGSVIVTSFSPELLITSDVDFYPVWGAIPVAPVPSAPNGFQNNPVATTPSSSSTTSPVATQSPTASSKSTAIAFSRVNGMTQVAFALPAKYEGGKAAFEVKRWINNRVRYFVISTAVVRVPDGSGRAALNFNFKLQLKPSDFIRIKVGKVTVLGKRLR